MISRRRVRPTAGFTLVELMIVVAILAIVAVAAARLSARSPRGDKSASFARGLILMAHEARYNALVLGTPTRLRLAGADRIVSEKLDTALGWIPLGGTYQAPAGVELCEVSAAANITTVQPSACPATTNARICFGANGRLTVPSPATSDVCPAVTAGTGATLYARSNAGSANPKTYKLVLFRLTGMPKLLDKW